MRTIQDVTNDRAHKVRCAQDIVDQAEKDNRAITPDEQTIFDKTMAEVEALASELAQVEETLRRREQIEALQQKLTAPTGRQTAPDPTAKTDPNNSGGKPFLIPARARPTSPLKAFKGHDAEFRAYRAGQWILATVFGNFKAQRWCSQNGMDIQAAMGTNVNTEGGFLVPEELSRSIIDLRETFGVFRRSARVWPMTSDTLKIPRRGAGVTIGPIGENPSAAITQSTPTFGQVQLVAKKAGGLALLSSEIGEDAVIDVADWIAQEFAYAFALYEDQCGFIGDGTSTYMGIRGLTNLLTTASGLAGAVAAASAHDTFAEIDVADIAKLRAALPDYAKPNARFYCSRACAELVFGRLKAAAGGNNVQTLQGGIADNYLGDPITISQVLPSSTGTINGTAMLFYGDLSKSSALGDRRDVRIFPSEHRYMDTDQIGIRGTERFDIINHDIGDTTTPGPIVGLMGTT